MTVVPFTYFSATNLRVPGVYVEANSAGQPYGGGRNALLIGEVNATSNPYSGTQTTGSAPVLVNSIAQVNSLCGVGSMLSAMYTAYYNNNPYDTIYVLPLAPGTTKATQIITITATSAAAGTLFCYVAGYLLQIAVTAAMTATQIATALTNAINANTALPVTAANTAGVITTTAKAGGAVMGDCPIVFNYYGATGGQVFPSGVNAVVAPGVTGSGDPDFGPSGTNSLALINNLEINTYVNPYVSVADNALGMTQYLSEANGTWSPYNDRYGFAFSGMKGTVSALETFGDTMNDSFTSILGISATVLQPQYVWTAAYAGAVAASASVLPSLPFTGLPLNGIIPPLAGTGFQKSDRNTLYFNGISATKESGNQSVIDLAITTYQLTNGVADTSWLTVNVPMTLEYVARYIQSAIVSHFPRCVIQNDPIQNNGSNQFITPLTLKAYAVAVYQDLCNQGVCSNPQAFAQSAYANIQGQNLIALFAPVTLAQPCEQVAVNLTFST